MDKINFFCPFGGGFIRNIGNFENPGFTGFRESSPGAPKFIGKIHHVHPEHFVSSAMPTTREANKLLQFASRTLFVLKQDNLLENQHDGRVGGIRNISLRRNHADGQGATRLFVEGLGK